MEAPEGEPKTPQAPARPLDAAAAHVKHTSELLELAKARYEEAKATHNSAKAIYEALEASTRLTAISSGNNLCESCARVPLSTIFGRPWPILKPQRRRVGDLFQAIERQSWCVLCKFLIEAFQIGDERQDGKLGAQLKARDSAIYFADDLDGRPWFRRAGLDMGVPSCSFVWLQTGMPTITGLPHICITFQPAGVGNAKPSGLVRPRQRDPLEAFNGAVNYDLLRSWIEKCTTHHGDRCNRKTNQQVTEFDIVLIEVSSRQLVRRSLTDRFVALSYVWGKGTELRLKSFDTGNGHSSDALKTSRRNQPDRSRLPKRVPQTVEDAITFVQWLGEKYLWIDLFCIDQNNPSEMQTQINAMDRIFSSAFVTLISLDGDSADWGLPGVSRSLMQTVQPSVNLNAGHLMATFMYSIWHNNGTSVWDSRAWTLQERLLSPRCIIFAKNYVAMACQEEYFHDCLEFDPNIETRLGDDYFRDDGSDIKLDGNEWDFKVYDALVSVYSGRKLTVEADALNACLGSLNRLSQSTGYTFCYGLPNEDILRALLWKPHHDYILERRPFFPSWSWLGWSGRTEYCYWVDDMADYADIPSDAEDKCVGPPSKRRRLQWFGEEVWHPEKAEVIRYPAADGGSHALVLSTTIAKYPMRKIRRDGVPHKNLRPDSQQAKTAVGDHWALLGVDSNLLRNTTGEHPIFEPTDVFFRVEPHFSKLLEQQQSMGEFAFVHEWRKIRDSRESNKWRFDMVSALLIIRNEDGTAIRLASIAIEKEYWIAQNPIAGEVTLV
ncbi:MAG: hypothetical protein M1839_001905 [Geoglossum umbratile]|nr:MAG: hypothetical protein M1839_001905 [Geoglossum umbratile]